MFGLQNGLPQSALKQYLVATDDQRIMDVCSKYNIPHMMTSENCENGTERIAEVSLARKHQYYMNIQGDEPCIDIGAINTMLASIADKPNLQFLQALSVIENIEQLDDPSVIKTVVNKNWKGLYFSRSKIPYEREHGSYEFLRVVGLYIYSRDFLKKYKDMPVSSLENIEKVEQLRVIENQVPIDCIKVREEGISVDTPSDLETVLKDYQHYFKS